MRREGGRHRSRAQVRLSAVRFGAVFGWMLALLAGQTGCRCAEDARGPAGSSSEVRVAAAADLTLAFEELGRRHQARTGQTVHFTFGSSGLLSKQVKEGAPFHVFAAAHEDYVDFVLAHGRCRRDSKALYAQGRVGVWTRGAPASLAELGDARFRRIAIAHPEHAPYGLAAKQALERVGLWDEVAPRIVYGENVRQALQFAQTGNAEAAVVAASLVKGADGGLGGWTDVDPSLHAPLRQALVVCAEAGESFAALVASEEGRQVLGGHGFAPPEGSSR